jgi:hypothetical protein
MFNKMGWATFWAIIILSGHRAHERCASATGKARQSRLPDGLFSNQKIPIWVNYGGPWN